MNRTLKFGKVKILKKEKPLSVMKPQIPYALRKQGINKDAFSKNEHYSQGQYYLYNQQSNIIHRI